MSSARKSLQRTERSMSEIVRGTAAVANASERRGWVMGPFFDTLTETAPFEVKLWHYDEQPNYLWKKYGGKELIVIYGGVLIIDIREDIGISKDTITLVGLKHDYVILPPAITKMVTVVQAPAFGVTVRYE